jgi:hypothetical protein
MKKPKGYIVYEGPSKIDGEPIVGIVTNQSTNTKTGNIMQLWIMRADVRPTLATNTGQDRSVCGDCKHRHFNGGACYVMPFTGPLGVWKAYKKGIYETLDDFNVFNNRVLRFGAYGDPHALPISVLIMIKTHIKNSTSYTHLWKTLTGLDLNISKQFTMASVDNIEEKHEAQRLGYRTFRVVKDYDNLESDEIICPNITRGVTCIECKLCNGNQIGAKNIVVKAHGVKSKRKLKKV